jgi:hypothetical protein
MSVISDGERRRIIASLSKYGAIALLHQKVQVHANGSKIPISKAYIDDEVIDPGTKYTIILIPEGTMHEGVFMMYYPKQGKTDVLYESRSEVIDKHINLIDDILDQVKESSPGVIVTKPPAQGTGITLLFEIDGLKPEDSKERLGITAIFGGMPSPHVQNIAVATFDLIVRHLKESGELYKAIQGDSDARLRLGHVVNAGVSTLDEALNPQS